MRILPNNCVLSPTGTIVPVAMMEQSPFKMDTFPNFFSGRCTTDKVDTADKADTAEAETDAEQPMMVIGQDKITV
jgi:hypothetical protein